MEEPSALQLPSFLRHASGLLEPFDPDRVHLLLYRATQNLGRPDTFLSRELTDGLLPFLAERVVGDTVDAAELTEVVVTALRELGHPSLAQTVGLSLFDAEPVRIASTTATNPWSLVAQAIQQRIPWRKIVNPFLTREAEAYSLRDVYPASVADAHREGLLTLGQLTAPRELGAVLLRWPGQGILNAFSEARSYIGDAIVLDSPECEPSLLARSPEDQLSALREAALACQVLDLQLAVHLRVRPAPGWSQEAVPLLFPMSPEEDGTAVEHLRGRFLNLAGEFPEVIQVTWHVPAQHHTTSAEETTPLAPWFGSGRMVRLQHDRGRQDAHFQAGLNRRQTALLQTIDLHVDRLTQRQKLGLEPEALAGKILSLARLALSAAKARRDFLRRWQLPGWPAFLLDQAHVCLRLCGLDSALEPLHEGNDPFALHEALVRRLPAVLQREAWAMNLTALVEPVQNLSMDRPPEQLLPTVAAVHAVWGRGLLRLSHHPKADPLLWGETLMHVRGLDQVEFIPAATTGLP